MSVGLEADVAPMRRSLRVQPGSRVHAGLSIYVRVRELTLLTRVGRGTCVNLAEKQWVRP